MSLRVCQRVVGAAFAVAVLLPGCGGGAGGSGEVVVVDPGAGGPLVAEVGPDPVPGSGPGGGGVGDASREDAVPVVPLSDGLVGQSSDAGAEGVRPAETSDGSNTGGSNTGGSGPGGGPGSGSEEVGPVGGTDAADVGACVFVDGVCVAVGGGFVAGWDIPGLPFDAGVRGGLVLLPDTVLPVGFTNEVLDLCDDSVAFLVANRRFLAPGEEPTEEEALLLFITRYSTQCDVEGGPRYIYMGNGGWVGPYATEEEALARNIEMEAKHADRRKQHPGGKLMGYGGMHRREFPLEERDEVVVLQDTITVKDGVVRGLVHNQSETLYARNVTVTARPGGGAEALVWRWPLTVQPGERAPFEIAGWVGPTGPADVAIDIAADLSPALDLSRSIELFESVIPNEPPTQIGDYMGITGFLRPPTSPPGLDELVAGQTIPDLRAYIAWLDADGTVLELEQLPTQTTVYYGECCWNYVYADSDVYPPPPHKLPADIATRDDLRYAEHPHIGPNISFVGEKRSNDYQAWIGGANPPPAPQQQPGDNPDE